MNGVGLRARPGLRAPHLKVLAKGTPLTILGEKNGFFDAAVAPPGKGRGWVVKWAVRATAAAAKPATRPASARLAAPTAVKAAAGPSRIESVRASAADAPDGATEVEILLNRRAAFHLDTGDKRVVVVFRNATPSPEMAGRLASGGLVERIGVEALTLPEPSTRLTLELGAPAHPVLVPGKDPRTLRLRLARNGSRAADATAAGAIGTATAPAAAATAANNGARAPIHKTAGGLYDVTAYQADAAGLLQSLARDASVSVVMTGAAVPSVAPNKVTVQIRQVPAERAIDLVCQAAGLAYRKEGDTFLVGTRKDLEESAPRAPAAAPAGVQTEVYACRHISASELAAAIGNIFGKDALQVSVGASPQSPQLDGAAVMAASGGGGNGGGAARGGAAAASGTPAARQIVVSGEAGVVARALALAERLDVRRAQVKIAVRITDISTDALRELGVQWGFSNVSIREVAPGKGLSFGTFTRSPLSFDAALSALEKNNRAKLLAAPALSLLDGERGFILIGERLLYPRLIGYTQAQTPIFDKAEERVGIYLQVAAQMAGDGEITLTIYPQVSVVTSFLNVNGASYPQISTREQQTTIRVKDGEQIVVGGLITDEELSNVQRVPFLSRIPLFGELFTYRKKNKRQSELVVTITPQILRD
jgi:hypothetical protein